MRLSTHNARTPAEKLRDYLSSTAHPDGRGKAEYLGGLGYSQDAYRRLEADLREQILTSTLNPDGSRPTGRSIRSWDH